MPAQLMPLGRAALISPANSTPAKVHYTRAQELQPHHTARHDPLNRTTDPTKLHSCSRKWWRVAGGGGGGGGRRGGGGGWGGGGGGAGGGGG